MSTRRNFIAGSAAIAASLASPATSNAASADVGIIAAWERWVAARTAFNALPLQYDEWHEQEENRLWRLTDQAEEDIREAKANTKEGAAIQLWIALAHSLETRRQDDLIIARDLPAIEQEEQAFDWNIRMIVSALRSLET
jgi:hypothetical protein